MSFYLTSTEKEKLNHQLRSKVLFLARSYQTLLPVYFCLSLCSASHLFVYRCFGDCLVVAVPSLTAFTLLLKLLRFLRPESSKTFHTFVFSISNQRLEISHYLTPSAHWWLIVRPSRAWFWLIGFYVHIYNRCLDETTDLLCRPGFCKIHSDLENSIEFLTSSKVSVRGNSFCKWIESCKSIVHLPTSSSTIYNLWLCDRVYDVRGRNVRVTNQPEITKMKSHLGFHSRKTN